MQEARSLPPEQMQRNYHHLVMNMTWTGLAMAATTRFLSVYAIRLGASPLELGLMASLPAIIALFSASLGRWWMHRYATSAASMVLPAFGLRMNYLMLACAPFLPEEWQSTWLIIAVALPALPQGIQAVIFTVAVREAVDDKLVTRVVSRRQMGMNLTLMLSLLGFGLWLENVPFPLNYQLMFLIGFGITLISLWHLAQIRTPPLPALPPIKKSQKALNVWQHIGFRNVAFVGVIVYVGYFAIVPVTPLWLVREFGAGETFIAAYSLAELAASALTAFLASALTERVGSRRLMALSMPVMGLAALVLALAPSLSVTMLAAILSGAGWTAASIALFGFFTENTSTEAAYSTRYMQILSLATFFGPLIGSALANSGVALGLVLLIGMGLRFTAGLLILLSPVLVRPTLSRPERLGHGR